MSRKNDRRGFVYVLVAGVMLLLCLCAALVIDVGQGYVVKNELQNAGDAGSLAAAANAYPGTGVSVPNWAAALAAANDFVNRNSAGGQQLSEATVQFGWWNVNTNSWEPGSPAAAGVAPVMAWSGVCSSTGMTCTADTFCTANEFCFFPDVPAVMTTIQKTAGVNGGAVQTFFGRVLGWNEFDVAARSVAIADTPRAMSAGTLFPFAVCQQVRDDFLTGNGPGGEITFTSAYSSGSGTLPAGGQWTGLTFNNPPGGANVLDKYVQYLRDPSQGTAPPAAMVAGYHPPGGIAYNSSIHIETGAAASLIDETNKLIQSGKTRVFMPVVANNVATNTNTIVRGFVSVELISATVPNTLKGRLVMPSKMTLPSQ